MVQKRSREKSEICPFKRGEKMKINRRSKRTSGIIIYFIYLHVVRRISLHDIL